MQFDPAEILARVEKNLPTLPATAIEIVCLCNDDDVEITQLADVLSHDPSLAMQVIRLANSARYCRRQDVTSIPDACVLLGMRALKIMALGFSLTKSVSGNENSPSFNYQRYWQHSVCMAVAARNFSRVTQTAQGDHAFLCGLISRIGQLTLANTIPEHYDLVLNGSAELPTAEQELQVLGSDHHKVTDHMLRQWEMPSAVITDLQDWSRRTEKTSPIQSLLQLSDQVATVISSEEKGAAYQAAQEIASQAFGLSCNELDGVVLQLREEIDFLADSLNIQISSDLEIESLLAKAREQIVQIALRMNDHLLIAQERETELLDTTSELRRAAEFDSLTQLVNRGSFDHTLSELISARVNAESQRPLSLLMLDVDHFKSFNDTYGHLAGDEVLRNVAEWIKDSVRATDVVARYGGEEFVAVLPTADLENLKMIAERIRSRVESGTVLFDQHELKVTISIGGACLTEVTELTDGELMIRMADGNMYSAKNNGRNNSVVKLVSRTMDEVSKPHIAVGSENFEIAK